jgi:hypothetical protein
MKNNGAPSGDTASLRIKRLKPQNFWEKLAMDALEDDADEATAPPGRRWLESRLSDAELAAISRQGRVCYERLASGNQAAKLRFRYGGRQRVVYIGVDRTLVKAVADEIDVRQRRERRRRALRRIVRQSREELRRSRRSVTSRLAGTGWYFHGFTLRQRRKSHAADWNTVSPEATEG